MQVFLPEYDFAKSASVLDTKRLVKQLLEGRQILQTIAGESAGWRNHPAVRMFVGHEGILYMYLKAIRDEMEKRNYKWQNNWEVIERITNQYFPNQDNWIRPDWMDDDRYNKVITTHRGRLFQKAPELYPQYEAESKYFMDLVCCPDKCTYFWVTHKGKI